MRWLSILVALLAFSTAEAACPIGQFFAEYYNNTTLSGDPVATGCEGPINYNWGTGGPARTGVPVDNFSVRWTGQFNLSSGSYTFTATTDDGIRVWLDNALIIDSWKEQAATAYTAVRPVILGTHDIKVEFYEKGGEAVAKLAWVLAPATQTFSPKLAWADNSSNPQETGFAIERCAGAGCTNFQLVATTAQNAQNYTDTISGDPGGVTYVYRVKAVAGAGASDSPYSNTASIMSPVIVTKTPPTGVPGAVTLGVKAS